MFAYIESLKAKPEHVRQRIALGASAGVTALVAICWVAVIATSGMFAIDSSTYASAGDDDFTQTLADTKSGFSQLLGAVGATDFGSDDAQIDVETKTTTTLDKGEATTIPF
jgi:hypothetical protein